MAAREWLAIIEESAYGVPIATGSQVYGTNLFYSRLDGGDAFTMRPVPVMIEVPYGGGYAIPAFSVSDKTELKGRLVTKLYQGAYSSFLMSWACQRINSGQTAPWTTTEPPGDLASCAITHSIQVTSGSSTTTFVRNYTGIKVTGWDLDISEDSQIGTLSLDLTGSTPAPAIPGGTAPSWQAAAPTDVQLPGPQSTVASPPFVFTHTSTAGGGTGLIVANSGTARTQFQSVKLAGKNTLMSRFWNSQYAQIQRFVGRGLTLTGQQFYSNSPDDRIGYEAITTQTPASFQLYASATNAVTWSFNTNSVFTSITDQLALSDLYLQTFTLKNQYDASTGSDYTITVLPSSF
jgi:hypothetical protein